jgi:CRP-like cAMP-binding protein
MAASGLPEESFWALLPAAERAALRGAGTVRRYLPGDIVCWQGERRRHVVVLFSGRVEIHAQGRYGQPVRMATRGAGDLVGEMAAVDRSPRSATVRALDELTALVVPEQRFVLLCRREPMLTWAVLRLVVERFRELGEQRADSAGSTVALRVSSALVNLAAQHDTGAAPIVLSCTQQELADMVGGSRESVVRALRELRDSRIISTARGRIVIHRPDLLRDIEDQ